MAQETEAKFYVSGLDALRHKLEAAGATLKAPRVLERNLRFDTARLDLSRAGRVLRLRQDARARLTYKEGGEIQAGALARREIEFAVGDLDAAREFLEALGYQVSFIYEKYRTTYELRGAEVVLDELPYGDFVEIEGEVNALRPVAEELGLRWEAAIPASYSLLFERLRQRKRLEFRDLTFDNLRAIQTSAADLGVRPADR